MKSFKVICNCKHVFQDHEHGKNIRVATPSTRKPSQDTRIVSCTVCGKQHTVKE